MPAEQDAAFSGADAELHGQYAGMVSRGIAWAIDISIVSLVGVVLFWLIYRTLATLGVPTSDCPIFVPVYDLDTLQLNLCRIARGGEYAVSLLLPQVYFILFWWLGGQTVGKAILGIKVIRAGGGPIRLSTALRRLLGYFIAMIPLGLGFFWALIDPRRQGWHDKLAQTYVIYWRIPRRRERVRQAVRRTAAPTYDPARPPAASGTPLRHAAEVQTQQSDAERKGEP